MLRSIAHADLLADFHSRLGIVPDYEAILEAGYRRLISPGETVIDVGAHTGRHTRVFAELVGPSGRVLAFEPIPEIGALIETPPQVTVFPFALSDQNGTASFVHATGTPQESGLRERIYNQPHEAKPRTITVKVRRLDEVAAPYDHVSFIKIDIEGAEIACLNGARETIERHRPFISVEYGALAYVPYGNTKQTLYGLASDLNYRLGDMFGALCTSAEEWEYICDRSYWDFFMIPHEQVSDWHRRLGATPP
jgi:FkbM family methyltransferase